MANPEGIILYVEDDEADRIFMGRAFAKEGIDHLLRTVNDGQTAIEYLSGLGKFATPRNQPLPAVVLLDLNLPERHGFEVLKWVRADPALAGVSVVIFSSSEREEDQDRARLLGADDFLRKPGSGTNFQDVARMLRDQYLCRVQAEG